MNLNVRNRLFWTSTTVMALEEGRQDSELSPKRIGLAYQGLAEIPPKLLQRYGTDVAILDLTSNNLLDFKFLLELPKLETLILDHNHLTTHVKFPFCPQMSTLWINHNDIVNLGFFISMLEQSFPNLQCLSMMNNPAAPSYFNDGTFEQYTDYRQFVISRLRNLRLLDDEVVTPDERKVAEHIYPRRLLQTQVSNLITGNNT